MIQRIRGYRILTAFRGRPAADLDALAEVLCRIGDLAVEWQDHISEMEINPLFVCRRAPASWWATRWRSCGEPSEHAEQRT